MNSAKEWTNQTSVKLAVSTQAAIERLHNRYHGRIASYKPDLRYRKIHGHKMRIQQKTTTYNEGADPQSHTTDKKKHAAKAHMNNTSNHKQIHRFSNNEHM
jgi:hypothetical protein